MVEENIIEIPNQNTKGITVRFGTAEIKDMDKVIKNLNEILGSNLSRNQFIELMYKSAKSIAKFKVNDKNMTFDEVLHYFDKKEVEINPDPNNEEAK